MSVVTHSPATCPFVVTLGECVCVEFYHGATCSIDERDPVEIDDIEGGAECDVIEGEECRCFVVRAETILETIQCHVNTYKVLVYHQHIAA